MFGQVSNVSFFCGLGRETTIGNGWGHIFDISMRMGGIGPQGILFIQPKWLFFLNGN